MTRHTKWNAAAVRSTAGRSSPGKIGERKNSNKNIGGSCPGIYRTRSPRRLLTMAIELRTQRLLLRQWSSADLGPFADMNSDPRVMKYFPSLLSRDESDAAAGRIRAHFERYGFGLWAAEIPDVAPFIGFVGLAVPRFEAHFTPCVEIGWRVAADQWNLGYATEAACAVLKYGFEIIGLSEIVSFTVPINL